MTEMILRRLARDQWVRIHGTPRVTVLAGGERAKAIWSRWSEITGTEGVLLECDLERDLRIALGRAQEQPLHPIAVLASPGAITAWRAGRDDRLAAMLDEGLLLIDEPASGAGRPVTPTSTVRTPLASDSFDARSVAEATLYEALERTPATTGRFELNGALSIRFGATAAEVDLLSRGDALAIEIDGYHHFTDVEHYRRDRRKDLLLQTQGLLVIRLLAQDVMRDVRSAVRVVCQGLAYRRAGGSNDHRSGTARDADDRPAVHEHPDAGRASDRGRTASVRTTAVRRCGLYGPIEDTVRRLANRTIIDGAGHLQDRDELARRIG